MLIPSDPVHAFVDYPDVPVPNAPGGALAGLTLAVKDIFDVAGYPTGCGNPEKRAESAENPPTVTAPAVQSLLDAGAVFVGKTHTAEIAFSLDGRNTHYGTPINPAAPGRVPGGSSSGSASATAAGLVDIAIGSDTGGSVRGPASMCGVIGLRPTHGRIDLGGAMPLAPSLDTFGWFTRDIDTYERVGAVLLGPDAVAGQPFRRMILPDDDWAILDPDEKAALDSGIDRARRWLGASERTILAEDGLAAWRQAFRVIQGFEAWRIHGPWIESRKPDLMPAVRGRFEAARAVTADEYREAVALRATVRVRLSALCGDDAVIVLPSLPSIAPRLDASEADFEDFRARALALLCASGLAGFPQISLPLGRFGGCPIGLSLIAPAGRDRALIALAKAVMQQ